MRWLQSQSWYHNFFYKRWTSYESPLFRLGLLCYLIRMVSSWSRTMSNFIVGYVEAVRLGTTWCRESRKPPTHPTWPAQHIHLRSWPGRECPKPASDTEGRSFQMDGPHTTHTRSRCNSLKPQSPALQQRASSMN